MFWLDGTWTPQLNDVRETAKSASPGLMKLLIISFFLDGGCIKSGFWS